MNHAGELTCRVQSQEDTLFRPTKISYKLSPVRQSSHRDRWIAFACAIDIDQRQLKFALCDGTLPYLL